MGPQTVIVYHSSSGRAPPATLRTLALELGFAISTIADPAEVIALVNRTLPRAVVLDGLSDDGIYELCACLKSDAFSAIVPVVVFAPGNGDVVLRSLDAGADEVLTESMAERERFLRFRVTLHRADRDVSVHPTTRLPGTPQIERDITDRIRTSELFAVCYADLDHFKEFNDRYGYNEGDRVIKLLSRILRDVVRGHAEQEGFIGHIGGDDFIFTVPLDNMRICCEEIIEIFDELIPYQYTEDDRRAGYFLGRDRRGNILWVPIMTLSIGVVTNQHRKFTHTARVSELATEMKSFAKKLPGSVYAVDRRSDARGTFFGRSIASVDELEARAES
jgi:GGDEF domain-containing protein